MSAVFDDRARVTADDLDALGALLRAGAPATSADAYRSLPAILAEGDDTPAAIEARIELALLSAREGLMESALYQIDELTKDARRVSDLGHSPLIVERADAARAAIEATASRATPLR